MGKVKVFLIVVAALLTVAFAQGCATDSALWYIEGNTGVLAQAGAACLVNPTGSYSAGLLYTYQPDASGQKSVRVEGKGYNQNLLTVAVVCGERTYTVTCDVTKKQTDGPCASVVKWVRESSK